MEMKINKIFIGLGASLLLLFLILSSVLAAPSDQKEKQIKPKWEVEKQDFKKGAKPQPKKHLKLTIQKHKTNQPLAKDNSNFGKRQERPEKADSLK